MDRSIEEHRVKADSVFGFCFECHHELVMSGTHACPECGRWFDQSDPSTIYRRKPGFLCRIWLESPGLAWFVLTVLMCALYLASESAPGGYFALEILVSLCFTLVTLSFIGELLLHFIALWYCGRPLMFERVGPLRRRPTFRRRELMWFMPPLLVLSSFFLARHDIPFRVAFRMSESSLKKYVLSPPANRPALPGWIGLFPVDSIDGNVINLTSGGLLQSAGLIYVDDVSQASFLADYYKDTGGSTWQINDEWIVFTQTF